MIYYVTSNGTKFQEVSQFVHAHLPDVKLASYNVDLEEVLSMDQQAVAVDKAQRAWHYVRAPLVIDDAGVYFDRYYAFPGAATKFIHQGIGLHGTLRLVEDGDRARFIVYVVYCCGPHAHDCTVFSGSCCGVIRHPRRIASSMPHSAVFYPDGSRYAYASLRERSEHHAFSPRIAALRKFVAWIEAKNR